MKRNSAKFCNGHHLFQTFHMPSPLKPACPPISTCPAHVEVPRSYRPPSLPGTFPPWNVHSQRVRGLHGGRLLRHALPPSTAATPGGRRGPLSRRLCSAPVAVRPTIETTKQRSKTPTKRPEACSVPASPG